MISDAYAAGFFDGEGSVYAATRNKYYKNPTIVVVISNTVERPLLECQKRWGGNIYCKKQSRKPRHRDVYQWNLGPRASKSFLTAIQPHLLIKNDVVAVALEYCALMELPIRERMDYSQLRPSKTPGKLTRAGVMRPEFRARIDALHARIRELNTRGAPANATRKYTIPNLAA